MWSEGCCGTDVLLGDTRHTGGHSGWRRSCRSRCRDCAGSGSRRSTTGLPDCWSGCRQRRSTGYWHPHAGATSRRADRTPNRDRHSGRRSRSARERDGTTRPPEVRHRCRTVAAQQDMYCNAPSPTLPSPQRRGGPAGRGGRPVPRPNRPMHRRLHELEPVRRPPAGPHPSDLSHKPNRPIDLRFAGVMMSVAPPIRGGGDRRIPRWGP